MSMKDSTDFYVDTGESDDNDDSEDSWLFAVGQCGIDDPPHRSVCGRCRRPTSVCLCPCLPEHPILVNSTVVVLQHPNEEKRSLATVPLLKACLPEDKCIVLKGRKFPSQKIPILTEVFKSKKSVLLYPSVDAEDLYSLPSWTDTCDVEEFRAIVVLDGTWNQARGLYAHNPDLKKMRKIKVSVKHESAYVIRTQPTKDSLCTLESVAYALSHLEDQPAIHHVLTEPLKLMCQYQINHGSSVHYSKDDSRYAQDKR